MAGHITGGKESLSAGNLRIPSPSRDPFWRHPYPLRTVGIIAPCPARVQPAALCQGIKALYHPGGHRHGAFPGENPVQRPAVSRELLLGSVAGARLSQDHRPEPLGRDPHSFYPVRRFRALDNRLFMQNFKHLGFLPHPQVLLSAGFHASPEEPSRTHRY